MFLTLGFLQSFTCVISLVSCGFLAYFQIQGNVKDFFTCIEVPEWLVYGNIISPGVLGFLVSDRKPRIIYFTFNMSYLLYNISLLNILNPEILISYRALLNYVGVKQVYIV